MVIGAGAVVATGFAGAAGAAVGAGAAPLQADNTSAIAAAPKVNDFSVFLMGSSSG